MNDRDSDFEDRCPANEASYDSDDPRGECDSCSASIPPRRTRCRSCLADRLGDVLAGTADVATERALLGIVHLVIESSNCYGAIAKGAAAATLLSSKAIERAVDDCMLIHDIDDELATRLVDRWPVLPDAVRIASADGERLLTAARNRTAWTGHHASDDRQGTTTFLYDESGSGIREERRLETLLDDVDDEAWLVPAIALRKATDENASDGHHPGFPITDPLECQRCGRVTEHRLRSHEFRPEETGADQPIWVCGTCGMSRGPDPT
ncbi:hypothetical protein ACERIT_08900 [Halopenitus sp. H-Gu1]|uniref:hypothetical protein n=1 Tax=Halopenitus sp. H-Gu1 TaxID=3242697 RepID=UPI00359DF822